MLMRVKGGADKAHIKAHRAALSALGDEFHAFGAGEPVLHIVIRVHKGNAQLIGKADIFVLADLIFLFRVNVGVVKEDGQINAVRNHTLHEVASAGRTAGVHQHFVIIVWRY